MTAERYGPPGTATAAAEPWGLVAACAALMAISAGIWYSASVFFVALLNEFRQDYALTAGIYSLFTVCYGLSGMISGELADRVGSRRSILLGGMLVPLALAANSLAPSLGWMYVSQGILVAFGMAACGYVPVSVLLTQSFHRHRGLAIGTASAGVGLGILAVVPLAQLLITSVGWRVAYRVLACLAAVVILPVAWLGLPRERPARTETLSPGIGETARGHPLAGTIRILLGAAARREFWLVAATFTLVNSPTQLVLTHHVAHLVEAGQPQLLVGWIVGLFGVVSIPAKILWGYLSDRWPPEAVYAVGVSCLVTAVGALMAIGGGTPAIALYAYATVLGFGYAVSPAMTPVLCSRFFGASHFGLVFGAMSILYHAGGAVGVWVAGYIHDLTGNYQLAFLASILAALSGVWCVWLAAPRRIGRPGPPRDTVGG